MGKESGQVSETSAMTPQGGLDGVPGTDDGVPPAQDAQEIPSGGPRDYSQGDNPHAEDR